MPQQVMLRRRTDMRPLVEKVAFLSRPDSYPSRLRGVQALETHMSWLFLVGDEVYKLKKPIHRERIDFTSLAARRLNCVRELRLNRRLAPDVYLGLVPLTREGDRRLALGGSGRIVDWLLRMRRLPEALALDRSLRMNRVTPLDAGRVVASLLAFHAGAQRVTWTPAGYRRRLRSMLRANARELSRPRFGLNRGEIERLTETLRAFVQRHPRLFEARLREGRVVEGHGDLRPEHVYLTDPPSIIDCLEFDRGLRLRDVADELAFLAMEADRLGHPRLDGWLFAAWRVQAGDDPARALIEFHKAGHALVRAKLAVWHMLDPDAGPSRRWAARAEAYLRLANGNLRRMQGAE
jgi:uncharacterized protein